MIHLTCLPLKSTSPIPHHILSKQPADIRSSTNAPGREQVEPGRGMVHVQQRLRLVLDPDAVLGLVVLGERAEVVIREGRARLQVLADLSHVEKLTTNIPDHNNFMKKGK